ncbi:hypothetical protein P5G51_012375 [Virgibacillus sp. 179-BFC.A HS]|uniref:Uncharacterized protein n=1 Tax=Tigheibacillus jepli TaxID=3035914 RepID=A0ABU5CID2_9BACI|nr:hypothetical protein [Virgibacillus sp. 179-BFC.A HS]MDY0406080.1 hypothetical protein [Virgibacillus sp. 179-BFC.A HS]
MQATEASLQQHGMQWTACQELDLEEAIAILLSNEKKNAKEIAKKGS